MDCLESIRTQNGINTNYFVELVVIDGGSSDNTVDVIKKNSDIIKYWISEPDNGQSDAINKGFKHATGDIYSWLCSDDMYLPGALDTVNCLFKSNPSSNFIYGDGYKIDMKGNYIEDIICTKLDIKNLENFNYIFSTSSFWTKDLWVSSGAFIDTNNHWTMDWELFLRMRKFAKFHYTPKKLSCLRSYPETKTETGKILNKRKRDNEIVNVSRKHGGYFCYNSIKYFLLGPLQYLDSRNNVPKFVYKVTHKISYFLLSLLGDRYSMLY